ncbi:MAG: LysE family translocator [Flexistipes sinusarabici]|uniref:LysE family translocator n=1 Tax=Flexistipes sinusarabici TaxID=2352 RepID=A0A5D0MMQ6_FLESI|nr:LysE family translocator [Flexistipes sinusarabici]TYB32893.1 MAG: LysE family translocator [Flexistipes sinusarabici]
MLSVETLVTFITASILLGLAPGPDNIFVLTQSALRGKGSGLIVMFGLCTGLIVHTTAVALGVAIVFKTSAIAFTVLKFIGAGYLLYLAWKVFTAPVEQIKGESEQKINYRKLYFRGIIMNITNPKVSIFFLAFLPQFADPTRGSITLQLMLLGGLFILATILVFGSIALLGGTFGQIINRSGHIQKILNKFAGAVFVVLALKLATSSR